MVTAARGTRKRQRQIGRVISPWRPEITAWQPLKMRGWKDVVELSKLLRERATEVALKAWETHQQRGLISDGAKAWSKRQRDEHVEELAARFDARPPDEVPF
jgi:hypothetical protein